MKKMKKCFQFSNSVVTRRHFNVYLMSICRGHIEIEYMLKRHRVSSGKYPQQIPKTWAKFLKYI